MILELSLASITATYTLLSSPPLIIYTHKQMTSDPNDVIAPPQQFALIGQSYTLDCSSDIEGVFISWQRDGQQDLSPAPLTISSVQLSDEGMYDCRVSINGASISKRVQFNVIGKMITIIPLHLSMIIINVSIVIGN